MSASCWAVVPAAGVGRRMGADVPKQYLQLGGRKVIEHTLARLLSHPRVGAVVVALGEFDGWWQARNSPVILTSSRHPAARSAAIPCSTG